MTGLSALARVVTEALTKAGVKTAILGLDVSFNEHKAGDFEPHWLLHYRAHLPERLSKTVVADLRAMFPREGRIPRPLKTAVFDGDLAGLAYSMKPGFGRRQSYQQVKRTLDGTRRCRNTRGRPLRGAEAVELAIFLDRIGLRRRLILHGARLVRSTDGTIGITRQRRSASDHDSNRATWIGRSSQRR